MSRRSHARLAADVEKQERDREILGATLLFFMVILIVVLLFSTGAPPPK